MRRGQGLFTTLLMLIPMTAVPVMAIFGIPQFVTVSASPFTQNRNNASSGYLESRVGQSDALQVRPVSSVKAASATSLDLFQPYGQAESEPDSTVNAGVSGNRRGEVSSNRSGAPAGDPELLRERNEWTDPLRMTRANADGHRVSENSFSENRPTPAKARRMASLRQRAHGARTAGNGRLTEVSQRIAGNGSRPGSNSHAGSASPAGLSGQASVPTGSSGATSTSSSSSSSNSPGSKPPGSEPAESRRTIAPQAKNAGALSKKANQRPGRDIEPGADKEHAAESERTAGRDFRYSRQGLSNRSAGTNQQAAGTRLTWRQAVGRLNLMGIRTYRLTPDGTENGYRFVCLVSSAEDPRISRRFEADSRDPLLAVHDVILQVEEWHAHR